jgi:predicted Zn-ribbon and HTH transcriptional regulator
LQKNINNKAVLEQKETKTSGNKCKTCGFINKNIAGKCWNCQSNLE